MSENIGNWEYVGKNFDAFQAALGARDIVTIPDQVYRGPGVEKVFGTNNDVAQARLGRRHFKGHEDFKFNLNPDNDIIRIVQSPHDYAVFVPLTVENMKNLTEGGQFQYSVARYIEEDKKGQLTAIDPERIERYEGEPEDLVALMPKKRIPHVTSVDVQVGSSVTRNVNASNTDDRGDTQIYSLKGISSLMYNPSSESPFTPVFYGWASNGWKEPVSVVIKDDQLFFDERKQPEGKLWLIRFEERGYDPIPQ